jgi:hypothetical protein
MAGEPVLGRDLYRLEDLLRPDRTLALPYPAPEPPAAAATRGGVEWAGAGAGAEKELEPVQLAAVLDLLAREGASARHRPLKPPAEPAAPTLLMSQLHAADPAALRACAKPAGAAERRRQREADAAASAAGGGAKARPPSPGGGGGGAAADADEYAAAGAPPAPPPRARAAERAPAPAPPAKRARPAAPALLLAGAAKPALAEATAAAAARVAAAFSARAAEFVSRHAPPGASSAARRAAEGKAKKAKAAPAAGAAAAPAGGSAAGSADDADESGNELGGASSGGSGAAGPKRGARSAVATAAAALPDLRALNEELGRLAAAGAGAVGAVDPALLGALLAALRPLADAGRGDGALLRPGDGAAAPAAAAALASLEAAAAALRVMAAPGAPRRVLQEEVAEAALAAARFHLHRNVLPFRDARLRKLARPDLDNEFLLLPDGAGGPGGGDDDGVATSAPTPGGGKGGKGGGRGKAAHASGAPAPPPALAAVADRLQALLGLAADLVPALAAPPPALAPLLRSAAAALAAPGAPLLQARAVALLGAAFGRHPELRRQLLHDVFSEAVPFLGAGRQLAREWVPAPGAPRAQALTGALLAMVQAAADLPPLDASPSALDAAYAPAAHAADRVWVLCLERLARARAAKADTSADFRAVLLGLVDDLLAAARLPQWPAAAVLLNHLASALSSPRGLHAADAGVRQACVEALGRALAALQAGEAAARRDEAWLEEVAESAGAARDVPRAARELLCKHLAGPGGGGGSAAAGARRFWLARAFAAEAAELQRRGAGPDELRDALLAARGAREELDTLAFDPGLSAEDVERLAVAAAAGALSRARVAMHGWLVELLDPATQVRLCARRSRGSVWVLGRRALPAAFAFLLSLLSSPPAPSPHLLPTQLATQPRHPAHPTRAGRGDARTRDEGALRPRRRRPGRPGAARRAGGRRAHALRRGRLRPRRGRGAAGPPHGGRPVAGALAVRRGLQGDGRHGAVGAPRGAQDAARLLRRAARLRARRRRRARAPRARGGP